MIFDLEFEEFEPNEPLRVGNVYPVRGGRGDNLTYLLFIDFRRVRAALMNKDQGHD